MKISSFVGMVQKKDDQLWQWFIVVPSDIVRLLKEGNNKRFLCSFNELDPVHSSMIPAGDGKYIILINANIRDALQVGEGDEVRLTLSEDESDYGTIMPLEFSEVMALDPEGDKFFHNLTLGKQRTLLNLVSKVKNVDLKIEKSIIILDHLKEHRGHLDFKILNQDFRDRKGKISFDGF